MGMISDLGRFLPNLLRVVSPMSELLKCDSAWNWSHQQQEALHKPTVVSANAKQLWSGKRSSTEAW